MPPPGVLMLNLALVPCDLCGVTVTRKSEHFALHFPSPTSATPCPRSWPGSKPRSE